MKTAHSVVLLALVLVPTAMAQTDNSARVARDGPYRSKVRVLDQDVAIDAPADAQSLLDEVGDDPYGKALAHRRLGFEAAGAKDYGAAIDNFEQALAQVSLAAPAQQQMRTNLAELYVATEQFERMTNAFERWQSAGEQLSAATRASAGLAYLRRNRFDVASELLAGAVQTDDAPRRWREWLLVALNGAGRFEKAAAIKSALMDLDSASRGDWLMLAALYQRAGATERATAALALAWRLGLLTERDDAITLAQLYLATGLPGRAATLLANELNGGRVPPRVDHLLLLASAHADAGEERAALAPLARAAAESDDATIYLQLARLQHYLGELGAARASLQRATRGDLGAEQGRAWLLLGRTHVALNEVKAARRAFSKASDLGGSYREASEWLARLETPAEDAEVTTAEHTPLSATAVSPAEPVPLNLETKLVSRKKIYYIAERLALADIAGRTAPLARRLSIAVRRERLEITGPLQLYIRSESGGSLDDLELQVALPVRSKVPGRGKFRSRTTDPFLCVPRVYEGSLANLGDEWRKLFADVAAAGLRPSGESRMVIIELAPQDRQTGRFELQLGVLSGDDAG